MDLWHTLRIAVSDVSQIGEARRTATRLGAAAGLDEQQAGRAAIVATELATNLSRHAVGGEILLQHLSFDDRSCVEIVAIDRGPGMADIERCLADGFSTGGTQGSGLGAVRRLSDRFDVWSQPGSGTVVASRIGAATDPSDMELGVVCVPYPGERACGDAWALRSSEGESAVIVIDGLGHGVDAARASAAGIDAFREASSGGPADIVTLAHARMSSTRGGAVAVATRAKGGPLCYGAIGNIAGCLLGAGRARGLMSQNGTVGAQIRQLRELEYECPEGAVMVLHSDGLTTRWSADGYPGLAGRHTSLLAAVLFRDFLRGRDDATVLAVRWKS